MQFCDGDNRGKVGGIKELAYRLDYRNYYTYYGAGRSWSNVKIQMADGDLGPVRISNDS